MAQLMAAPIYVKMRTNVDIVCFHRDPNGFYGFDEQF